MELVDGFDGLITLITPGLGIFKIEESSGKEIADISAAVVSAGTAANGSSKSSLSLSKVSYKKNLWPLNI